MIINYTFYKLKNFYFIIMIQANINKLYDIIIIIYNTLIKISIITYY